MGENNQDPDTLPEADRTVTAMGYDCGTALFTAVAARAGSRGVGCCGDRGESLSRDTDSPGAGEGAGG